MLIPQEYGKHGGGSIVMGVSPNGWFLLGNIPSRNGWFRGTPISGNLQIGFDLSRLPRKKMIFLRGDTPNFETKRNCSWRLCDCDVKLEFLMRHASTLKGKTPLEDGWKGALQPHFVLQKWRSAWCLRQSDSNTTKKKYNMCMCVCVCVHIYICIYIYIYVHIYIYTEAIIGL